MLGGCLSRCWSAWQDRGVDPWVMEVLREGYRIPLLKTPPLSDVPLQASSYSPSFTKGKALAAEVRSLLDKGAVEPAPLSPGFYSCMFVVMKTSCNWWLIIGLSTLDKFVMMSKFRMETVQSVLLSGRGRLDVFLSLYICCS